MPHGNDQGRIAVIGVGLLGTAVAQRLLAAGYAVAGYDTRPEQLQALTKEGLTAAGSIAGALQGAEAAILVLPSLESAETVVTGADGVVASAAPGTVVLQMSTLSPDLVRRLAEACNGAGLPFLDTPISGTSHMVARGDSTLLVGGDAALVERCTPMFDAIAPRHVHMGAVGSAAMAKLVANLLLALNVAATAEALVLSEKGGVPAAQMLEFLRTSAAGSRMLDIRGPMMVEGNYPAQMKLELFMKDLSLMLAEGERVGAPLPLTQVAQTLYRLANDSGLGGNDLAAVMTSFQRLAGLRES